MYFYLYEITNDIHACRKLIKPRDGNSSRPKVLLSCFFAFVSTVLWYILDHRTFLYKQI
jgi:hypothetical protein